MVLTEVFRVIFFNHSASNHSAHRRQSNMTQLFPQYRIQVDFNSHSHPYGNPMRKLMGTPILTATLSIINWWFCHWHRVYLVVTGRNFVIGEVEFCKIARLDNWVQMNPNMTTNVYICNHKV